MTTRTTTPATTPETDTSARRSFSCGHRRQVLAVVTSVVAALATFGVTSALGIDISVPEPPDMEMGELIAGRVAFAAAVFTVAAIAVARFLSARVADARRTFLIVAGAVLVASFVPSFLLDEQLSAKLALAALHVAVAVPVLVLVTPPRR